MEIWKVIPEYTLVVAGDTIHKYEASNHNRVRRVLSNGEFQILKFRDSSGRDSVDYSLIYNRVRIIHNWRKELVIVSDLVKRAFAKHAIK